MKKFRYLPAVLMMVLCLAVLAVGIYALKPKRNSIEGTITLTSSNPGVNLTAYYVPEGVVVSDAVMEDANKIGTTKSARTGVKLNITDSRLAFNPENANKASDVKPQVVAIKIENTSNKTLGAYFTDTASSTDVKTTMPLSSYTSSLAPETLVSNFSKVDFSRYTKVGGNNSAIVTLSVSLLTLSTEDIYIKLHSYLVIEDYNEDKLINKQTDPHLALNATEEAYTFTPTRLSTTTTTMDAETYDVGDGKYLGVVNLKYEDDSATEGQKTTFSFNYYVTTTEGTISAEEIFSGESEIGLGKYVDVADYLIKWETGSLVFFQEGTDYWVEGNTITVSYTFSKSLNFAFGHVTAPGMKLHFSVANNNTNVYLMEVTSNGIETETYLTDMPTEISTARNVTVKNSIHAGVIPIKVAQTDLQNPSFNLMVNYLGNLFPAEGIGGLASDLGFGLFKGRFNTFLEFVEAGGLDETGKSVESCSYNVEETKIIFTNADFSQSETYITLLYIYETSSISDVTPYLFDENNTNIFSIIAETITPTYNDFVLMDSADSFDFTFVKEPTQITKGDLSDNVSITTIALRNIPQQETPQGAVISTSADYGSVFIAEKWVFDMYAEIGMTLAELGGALIAGELDSNDIYVSMGTLTPTGTEFEISESYLNGGNATYVLIMLCDPSEEDVVKNISFGLSMREIVAEVVYTLSADGNYYTVSGTTGAMSEIKIPATYNEKPVKEIAASAFKSCTATTIDLSEATNLTTIGESAFENSNITSLTIPSSITSIGDDAFASCRKLTKVNYYATNAVVGEQIFYDAGNNGNGITLTVGANVEVIPNGLFETDVDGQHNLTTVAFEDGSVCTTIGEYAFGDCYSLTNINLENLTKLTTIGEGAFSSCESLQSITIPEGVISIGDWAFSDCSELTAINYNAKKLNALASAQDIFNGAGEDGEGITLTIGSKVQEIPNFLFVGSENIEGDCDFNLVSVTFEAGSVCELIGSTAFAGCRQLTNVDFTNAKNLKTISDGAFVMCVSLINMQLEKLVNLENVGRVSFGQCQSLQTITIPEKVTTIGYGAFAWCYNLTEINYNAINVTSDNNCIFSMSAQNGAVVDIGAKVQVIPERLFNGSTVLSVDDGVGPTAAITQVNFDENSVCHTIKAEAFANLYNLTKVTIPASITTINDGAFRSCNSLVEVINLSSLPIVKGDASYGAVALYAKAVYNTENYETVIIVENNVQYWVADGEKVAIGLVDRSVSSISIANDCTKISGGAFRYCNNIQSVTIPSSVLEIGARAFMYCANLKSVVISNGSIGGGAFANCSKLASVTINEGVTIIGENAFYGTVIESITIPSSVISIGLDAFGYVVKTITIKAGTAATFQYLIRYPYTLTINGTQTAIASNTQLARVETYDSVYTKQ